MSETSPETTGVELAPEQEGAETANELVGDPTPTGPTTSPDVVITDDPGPAPEGDAPVDDDSNAHVIPLDGTEDDPASDDQVVNVLGDDSSDESA